MKEERNNDALAKSYATDNLLLRISTHWHTLQQFAMILLRCLEKRDY
jgi:hypothetical protein